MVTYSNFWNISTTKRDLQKLKKKRGKFGLRPPSTKKEAVLEKNGRRVWRTLVTPSQVEVSHQNGLCDADVN